jgi:hypothetical protein
VRQWSKVNHSALQGRLAEPAFEVHSGKVTLGSWHNETRTMSFAIHLIEEGTEYEFDFVLRHEMAHQFTDEILKPQSKTPHGDGFRYACKLLGIHHASKFKMGAKPDKMALKIKKLLQLALSDNPHESDLAASRARHLMEKHHIQNEETKYIFHHLAKFGARRRAADMRLVSILNRHFSISIIWVQSRKIEHRGYCWHVEIMGTPQDINVAIYTFEYLSREIEKRWLAFRKTNKTGTGDKRSFQLGLLSGLDQKLSAPASSPLHSEENQLLILQKNALSRFVHSRYPNTVTSRGRSSYVTDTYHDGMKQGINLHIPQGVKEGPEVRQLE